MKTAGLIGFGQSAICLAQRLRATNLFGTYSYEFGVDLREQLNVGGDHSIGYPTVRQLAPHVDGPIGIIHFDRHVNTQETDLDERMHTTPWFHATNIPNAPATNLVRIGIGGWQAPRAGVKVGRERGTTVITIGRRGTQRCRAHRRDGA